MKFSNNEKIKEKDIHCSLGILNPLLSTKHLEQKKKKVKLTLNFIITWNHLCEIK